MKNIISILTVLSLFFACVPEENNTGDNNGNNGTIHVTGISLDRPTITIKEGESVTLIPTVTPDNAANKAVIWSTSSEAVATVDQSGKVTGVKAGNATITATTEDGGKKASCALSVEANLAPSVTVEAKNVSAISAVLAGKANLGSTVASDLKVGFQYSKSAGILPSNSTTIEATDADASYNYSTGITGLDPETKYYFRSFVRQNGQDTYGETKEFTTKDVASLLETRDASGVEAAKATLNAKLDLIDVKYSSKSYGFYWGTSETTLNNKLNGGEIKDNAYSSFLNNLPHKTQYWYKAYVKLDSKTFYGEVKTFTTEVVKVESISLNKTEHTFNTIGKTLTLKATVLPADATDKNVSWTSDKEVVATVDANGLVTAKGNGKATITVKTKDQKIAATCKITVAQWVTKITLNNTSLTLKEGQTASLSVNAISPDNAADKSVTWTTSNSKVATVDNSGKVTARASGTATIRATANDGSGVFASCSVVVFAEKVDMGIKTSDGKTLYWSTRNLCESGFVNSPEKYGDYYAWGETQPYYSSQSPLTWKNGKSLGYYWASYKWCNGSSSTLTKYNTKSSYGTVVDNKTVLKSSDDVASVKLGGKWRMPTDAEWTELRTKCTWTWTTNYNGTGVKGRIVTAPNGNSIFLPAAGCWDDIFLNYAGSGGHYWSSSLNTDDPNYAWYVGFSSGNVYRNDYNRCGGHSVRPVYAE